MIILALCTGAAAAQTQYVTDQLKITLRTGPSTEHRVLHMLSSGTPVEVLDTDDAAGYTYVSTKDGKTGYVLTRLLMNNASARERLVVVESRLAELQQEPGRLTSKLAALQDDHESLQALHRRTESENRSLQKQLEDIRRAANDAINITNERNMLRKRVAALNGQVGELKLENHDLHNQSERKWFLMGAGAIIVGIVLGLILPRLRLRRRRDSWGSLSGF